MDNLLKVDLKKICEIDLEYLKKVERLCERTQDDNSKLFSMFTKYNKNIDSIKKDINNINDKINNKDFNNNNMPNLYEGYINLLKNQVAKNENDILLIKNEINDLKNNNNKKQEDLEKYLIFKIIFFLL